MTAHPDLLVSMKIKFIDPDNLKLGWFRDVYIDDDEITMDDIISRASLHPNYIEYSENNKTIKKSVMAQEYNKSRDSLIKFLCGVYEINYHYDIYYIEELASYIEKATKINIDYIEMCGISMGGYDAKEWSLKFDEESNYLSLESPKMPCYKLGNLMYSILNHLGESCFVDISGGFEFTFSHKTYPIRHINWFKATVLYNAKSIFRNFSTLSNRQRKQEIHRMFFGMSSVEIKMNLEEIMNKTLSCNVYPTENEIRVVTGYDISNLLNSDYGKVIDFYKKTTLLFIEALDPDVHREDSIKRLKSTIHEIKIYG